MIRLLTSTYKNNKEKATKLARCIGLMDAPCGLSSIVNCGCHNFCKYCEGADYEVANDLRRLFLYTRRMAMEQVETTDEARNIREELMSWVEKETYDHIKNMKPNDLEGE